MQIPVGGLSVALARDFGSPRQWLERIGAQAQHGHALLAWSPKEAGLVDRPGPDVVPLLALAAADELADVDMNALAERYAAAVADATSHLAIDLEGAQALTTRLDVRRDGAHATDSAEIAGAIWRDPTRVEDWAASCLSAPQPVLVYCVHGHEVGQSTAARLRRHGIDARYLVGGIEAWRDAGLPLQPRERGPGRADTHPCAPTLS